LLEDEEIATEQRKWERESLVVNPDPNVCMPEAGQIKGYFDVLYSKQYPIENDMNRIK